LRGNEIGEVLWGSWITSALESGALKCMPGKEVVGRGLEAVQLGMDTHRKGVSAKKVVVEYI